MRSSPIIFMSLLWLCSALLASAEQRTIESLSLGKEESRSFIIQSDFPVKVGFLTSLSMSEAKKCRKGGIHISTPGLRELDVSSCTGTEVELKPNQGKVEFTLMNREKFPIGISVFRD